ncbi:MAG TPA: right-handed parallel beta-helix repeat-containing protein [Labilithrix sp.]|nr:right-handed parallel beta-helix repeat-containing protein [Labilithrix sp.]
MQARLVAVALVSAVVAACPAPAKAPGLTFDPDPAHLPASDALASTAPKGQPAVKRGGAYAGFAEELNRHYTEPAYAPAKTVYVSPTGSGGGDSAKAPASVSSGLAKAKPGTRVVFQKGTYAGCFGYDGDGGTYDAPIVFYGERNADGSRGVRIDCCSTGRMSCFNFEAANYVAVDGFELRGGKYGVRAVGADYAARQHSRGIAVMNSLIDGQTHDGVLTGASDWDVFENNVVSNSGEADGHGIYLSNGSDFNVVRGNDLFGNHGATFQINADPLSTCDSPVATDECDAVAGTGDGGRGASDFMLVENNYFHHGTAQGSNFTSVRYSTVRNNVFASWGRHGVSFWSETADPGDRNLYDPKLGSHHNSVHHNLFAATNDSQMLQFIANSTDCDVRNNLFIGMTVSGTAVRARPSATWLETDDTVKRNVYENNVYIAGKFDGRPGPGASETARQDLDAAWFAKLPTGLPSTVADFQPRPGAPFLDRAPRLPSVSHDRDGKPRGAIVDVGPFELP